MDPVMNEALRRALTAAICEKVIAEADHLTALDQAIGDADHGVNMKRGFGEVLAIVDQIAAKPLPDALKTIGSTLVMKVGGASGPLFGTLFLALAKAMPAEPSQADATQAFRAAFEAVAARGKSTPGQKTMLDVLSPVADLLDADLLDAGLLNAGGADLLTRLRETATAAADATIPMKAERGRASFLGDRSIGHMDPGACSTALILGAICDVLEKAHP